MTPAERHEAKLRELVETAGFELAVSLDAPGRFRIVTKADWSLVAWASTSPRGFDVVFPRSQTRVTSPTDLVDELEKWKGQSR